MLILVPISIIWRLKGVKLFGSMKSLCLNSLRIFKLFSIFWQSIYTIFYLFTISDTIFSCKKTLLDSAYDRDTLLFFYVFECFPACMCVHHLCTWCCRGHRVHWISRKWTTTWGLNLSPVLCKRRKCTYVLAVSPFSSSRFMIMPFARYLKICCKLFFILLLIR